MASTERPTVRIRLRGGQWADGEIPLTDLAKIGEATQLVVRRIGRELVEQRRPGRAAAAVERATALTLIGLRPGSTILEVAGVEPGVADVFDLDLELDLSARALDLWVRGLEALSAPHDKVPELPVGFDYAMSQAMDDWLRPLRNYESVGLVSRIGSANVATTVVPRTARLRLREVQPQPSLPWVSSTNQAMSGYLYQGNLNTGGFTLEDDTGHSVRLQVAPDLRAEAARLLNSRVQAVGKPEVNEAGRLSSFIVTYFEPLPGTRGEQHAFWSRQQVATPSGITSRVYRDDSYEPPGSLADYAVQGLSDDDVDRFTAAMSSLDDE